MTATPAGATGPAARPPEPVHYHSPLLWNVSKAMFWTFAKLWLRYRVEGREHCPRTGPLLIVANHGSYLDPPLLGTSVPRFVHFLAQSGLARHAPLRWWLHHVGVSLIDRRAPSKDVLRLLSRSLESGNAVAMFPEGTRSATGAVMPFRTGVEFLVRRTGAPVLPMGIEGSFAAFPRGAKFPRLQACTVRLGAPWPADRVLAPGGVEALRLEVARLAQAPLGEPAAPPAPDGAESPASGTAGPPRVDPDPIRQASDHGSGAAPADPRTGRSPPRSPTPSPSSSPNPPSLGRGGA